MYKLIYGNKYAVNEEETSKNYSNEELFTATLDFLESVEEENLDENGKLPDDWSDTIFGEVYQLIAIKVGYVFSIIPLRLTKEINLEKTGSSIKIGEEILELYRGKTYEDSRKIDEIIDREDVREYKIDEYIVEENKEYDFSNAVKNPYL